MDEGKESSVICPNCNSTESQVIDCRSVYKTFKRRRECTGCGHRWTTYETQYKPTEIKAMVGKLIDNMIGKGMA